MALVTFLLVGVSRLRPHQVVPPSWQLPMPLHVGPQPEGQSRRLTVNLDHVQFNHQWQTWKLTFAHNCCDLAPASLGKENGELYWKRMPHRMSRSQNSKWSLLWCYLNSSWNHEARLTGSIQEIWRDFLKCNRHLISPSPKEYDLMWTIVLGIGEDGQEGEKKISNISLMFSVVV